MNFPKFLPLKIEERGKRKEERRNIQAGDQTRFRPGQHTHAQIRPENPSGEMRGSVYSHLYFQSNTTSAKDVVRYFWSILAYCRTLGKTRHSLCHPKRNFQKNGFCNLFLIMLMCTLLPDVQTRRQHSFFALFILFSINTVSILHTSLSSLFTYIY